MNIMRAFKKQCRKRSRGCSCKKLINHNRLLSSHSTVRIFEVRMFKETYWQIFGWKFVNR